MNGVITAVPSGAKAVILQGIQPLTTAVTFHTLKKNVDYVVPSGSEFYFLGMFIKGGSTTRTLTITRATAADSETGAADKIVYVDSLLSNYMLTTGASIRIDEDLYINYKVDTTAGSCIPVLLYGYEVLK